MGVEDSNGVTSMTAMEKYQERVTTTGSVLCVGLDTDMEKVPERFRSSATPQFDFNKWIIEQTHADVCAYKPNVAFYEARGEQGIRELQMTMDYLRNEHPTIFTIADAKRGDIGNTNRGYVTAIFDTLGFDAVTLHPYLGQEAIQPFLDRKDKVSIFLCKTTNPGAGEFQDLKLDGTPLWMHVATRVSQVWNTNNNCMVVVGATYPTELHAIRKIVGHMPFLVPGVGAQGGDITEVLSAGLSTTKRDLIINVSRDIIFANDPSAAAKKLNQRIKDLLQ